MDRKQRTLEELITLQDQAIEALKQALAATQLALDAVTKARTEHGTKGNLFEYVPNTFPYAPYTTGVMNKGSINTGDFQKWNNVQVQNGQLSVKTTTVDASTAEQNACNAITAAQGALAQNYLSAIAGDNEISKIS